MPNRSETLSRAYVYGLFVMCGKGRAYDARKADIRVNTKSSDRHFRGYTRRVRQQNGSSPFVDLVAIFFY